MSMYILKPWYKSAGSSQTTTYDTISMSASNALYMNEKSAINDMTNICPSYSLKTTKSSNGYSYYSHTITLPKLNYSDLHTSGTLYNKYSTNQTTIVLSDTYSVTSWSGKNTARSNSTSTYSSTFEAGLKNGLALISNSNYLNCGYSTSATGRSSSGPDYICKSALPYSFDIFTTANNTVYNLVSNYMRRISKQTSTWSTLVYKWKVVYHEKSDPTKVTIFFDNGAAPLNGYTLTIYKATLSEVPA